MTRRLAHVLLVMMLGASCTPERVEVGDAADASTSAGGDGASVGSPGFPISDAGPAQTSCGALPIIGRCEPCPNGYVTPDSDADDPCACCP